MNENKLRAMYEWEERKIVKDAIEKRTAKQEKERGQLEKQIN